MVFTENIFMLQNKRVELTLILNNSSFLTQLKNLGFENWLQLFLPPPPASAHPHLSGGLIYTPALKQSLWLKMHLPFGECAAVVLLASAF